MCLLHWRSLSRQVTKNFAQLSSTMKSFAVHRNVNTQQTVACQQARIGIRGTRSGPYCYCESSTWKRCERKAKHCRFKPETMTSSDHNSQQGQSAPFQTPPIDLQAQQRVTS
ncbi:hypothetical protein E2320_008649 [Naja naja]|nr:hypothetical protein E2320_008649 [Naja naja]